MSEPLVWLSAIDDPLLRARFLGAWGSDDATERARRGAADVVRVEHALEQVLDLAPDAIVVDDSHPATPDICAQLRREHPATRIVVLTAGHRERAYRALCAGAFSVVDARASAHALHGALEGAVRDEARLDMASASMLLAHIRRVCALQDDPFANIARLTLVEERVLTALAAGRSIREVATERQVTARAVSLQLGFAVRRLHQHTSVATHAMTPHVLGRRQPINAGSADTSR
jgi:DNA-binding NarL/FixJ family response regulator